MSKQMTPQEEYDFYADPANQAPQGPARRRRAPLTKLVPVRLAEEVLAEIRRRAEADDRTVSAWIRRAVDHELKRPTTESIRPRRDGAREGSRTPTPEGTGT